MSDRLRVAIAGDLVRLHFADGDPAEADVLVGVDGINSAVRRQLLPQAEAARLCPGFAAVLAAQQANARYRR